MCQPSVLCVTKLFNINMSDQMNFNLKPVYIKKAANAAFIFIKKLISYLFTIASA